MIWKNTANCKNSENEILYRRNPEKDNWIIRIFLKIVNTFKNNYCVIFRKYRLLQKIASRDLRESRNWPLSAGVKHRWLITLPKTRENAPYRVITDFTRISDSCLERSWLHSRRFRRNCIYISSELRERRSPKSRQAWFWCSYFEESLTCWLRRLPDFQHPNQYP